MLTSSVDTTSQSFALGQVTGVLSVALIGIVLLWKLTGTWRAPSTPPGGDPAETARTESQRRLIVIGATVLIAAVAGVQATVSYNPEPRASEATAAAAVPADPANTDASAPRSIALPDGFADYRLMTGAAEERTAAEVMAGRKKLPEGTKVGYYDRGGDENLELVVLVRSVQWDPKLYEEKARDSISQEFINFFAGAKAREVTGFEAGPHGGRLSCGLSQGTVGDQAVCAWSDATTFAAVRFVREADLAAAAKTTLTLRNTATH
ncbi:hypothetical protein ACFWP3_20965 [Streptomyces sp. NPDC058525]|uniref:hypothetical protein n=1 Tax=Streptomyces sp. NPDC058525 TaxID=3346538 RepID=UPI003668686D